MIMNEIEANPSLAEVLQMHFYEGDSEYIRKLQEKMSTHAAWANLRFIPEFQHITLDLEKTIQIGRNAPDGTFSFIDPFGYKEISLDLLLAVSQQWGCDTLFYFNASGIERNIRDISKSEQMVRLFGLDGYNELKSCLDSRRESSLPIIAVEMLKTSLTSRKRVYFLPFCMEFDERRYPSHFLIFLSKHQRGFQKMREIMIRKSLKDTHGFPLYMHSPQREKDAEQWELPLVLQESRMSVFAKELLKRFGGKTITYGELTDRCLILGCPYPNALVRKTLWHMLESDSAKSTGRDIRSESAFRKNDALLFRSE
jgi:three-Cys-motif partner protein